MPTMPTGVTAEHLLFGAIALALLVAWYFATHQRMRIVTVIDGDTYVAISARGKRYKIRLWGADCPESSQSSGSMVTLRTKEKLLNQWVDVRLRGRDRYKRHLASINVEGEDLAGWLVSNGLAYPLVARYKAQGLKALMLGRGVRGKLFEAKPWESSSRRFRGLWRLFGATGRQRK